MGFTSFYTATSQLRWTNGEIQINGMRRQITWISKVCYQSRFGLIVRVGEHRVRQITKGNYCLADYEGEGTATDYPVTYVISIYLK